MSCAVCCRCGLDPVLLWLWCRLMATAGIQPLAWEPPYGLVWPLKKKRERERETKKNSVKLMSKCQEGKKFKNHVIIGSQDGK